MRSLTFFELCGRHPPCVCAAGPEARSVVEPVERNGPRSHRPYIAAENPSRELIETRQAGDASPNER